MEFNLIKQLNPRSLFIYLYVFFNEFSFFMVLPHIAISSGANAFQIGSLFTYAVILESFLMIFLSGWIKTIKVGTLYLIAPLLFGLSYFSLIKLDGIEAFYMFFTIMSVAKSLGKPFSRTALSLVSTNKDRIFINISLVQNLAIVIAPLAGALTLGSESGIYTFMLASYIIFGVSSLIIFFRKNNVEIKGNDGPIFKGYKNIFTQSTFRCFSLGLFFSYVAMGIFITGIVSSSLYLPDLTPHVGLFFSVVGITICFWQFYLSKTQLGSFISQSKFAILAMIVFSALFFVGKLPLAILSIIAYGMFESVLIPRCYKGSTERLADKYHNQAFAILLVLANFGEATGSFLTGVVINDFTSYARVILGCSVVFMGLVIVQFTYKR
ncbi:MFS transporter [Vibrio chagasii]|uniref:MFS transporter n=1 Tax=Vibrio chagasii TaxID=170679 RepID=UPI003DA0BAC1